MLESESVWRGKLFREKIKIVSSENFVLFLNTTGKCFDVILLINVEKVS